jgi:hypothetical protein
MLYGCGAANLDVTCKEYSDTTFLCVCPGEQVSYVAANSTAFQGCGSGGSPPSVNTVIASINATNLEAFLVNGMEHLLGAAVVTINGNTFTLNVNATVPIDGLTVEMEKEIAAYLGAGYTAADVTVQFTTKKRVTGGTASVTVTGQSSSASNFVPITAYLFIGVLSMVTLF